MANLIISVVAIALVAIAAVAAAYYGGTAFLSGQNKAAASTLTTQASQITGAMKVATTDGSGTNITGDYGTQLASTSTLITANYLSSVPSANIGGTAVKWYIGGTTGTGTPQSVYADMGTSAAAMAACIQAGVAAGQTGYTTTMTDASASTGTELATTNSNQYGCVKAATLPSDWSSANAPTGDYIFYYRAS